MDRIEVSWAQRTELIVVVVMVVVVVVKVVPAAFASLLLLLPAESTGFLLSTI